MATTPTTQQEPTGVLRLLWWSAGLFLENVALVGPVFVVIEILSFFVEKPLGLEFRIGNIVVETAAQRVLLIALTLGCSLAAIWFLRLRHRGKLKQALILLILFYLFVILGTILILLTSK